MPHLTINTRISIAATRARSAPEEELHIETQTPHTHTARPQFPIRTISISRHLSGQNPPNELGRGEAQMDVAPPYVRTYYVVQCTHVLVHSEHWAGKKCWPISWRKLMLLWQAQSQKEGNGGTEKN